MALEGTFKDFGLTDIFQLVGLQKKTGVLTVRGASGQLVTVSFEKGMVAFADEFQRTEAELLGQVLLRTRRLEPQTLGKAMEIQKATSQRLGRILVENEFISAQDLIQALQLQVKETVYRLFRWKEGSYHFSSEPVTFDREVYAPLPVEFVLMEGVRMIDEWPVIEKKIPNFQLVLERVPGAAPPISGKSTGRAGDLVDLMAIVEDGSGEDPGQPLSRGGGALGSKELALLQLVDGRRTVQELIDIGQHGEFETCKMLYGLLSLSLVRRREEQTPPPVRTAEKRRERPRGEFIPVVVAAVLYLLAFLFNPWGIVVQGFRSRQSRQDTAVLRDEIRLRRVRLALEVFSLEKQSYPATLGHLAETGLVRSSELRDHEGRPFQYRVTGREFSLGKE